MKSAALLAILTLCATPRGEAATTSSTKTAAHKTTANHARTASRPTSHGRKVRSRSSLRRATPHQLAPTPERYKEIQQALVERGYLKTPPNGVWDSASQDAMRSFQSDQKLDPTGKLTAASLIALGLGPKQSARAQTAPTQAAPTQTAQPAPPPADSKPAILNPAPSNSTPSNPGPDRTAAEQ